MPIHLTRNSYLISLLIAIVGLVNSARATHYRAGEITYKQLVAYTYEISVITYTDPVNTGADRTELEVNYGDGKSEIVPRSNGNGQIVDADLNNRIKKNIYTSIHTYPGPFNYTIWISDPNRIDQIRNINGGNSVQIPFYVESLLTIKEGIGNNQSPVLLLPPIDVGCIFQTFTHNPAAYDPDGDSLAFSIVAPKRAVGVDVQNFTIPIFSDSFAIDINTGQLTWNKPVQEGHYNWAILIREFRGGKLIGFVIRDMQVYINGNCNNSPPVISNHIDTCVEANQFFQKVIRGSDPNPGQTIKMSYFGSPFVQLNSPATINPAEPSGPAGGIAGTFSWRPSCNAIRYRPHMAVFKVTDNDVTKPLSAINYWNIKVVGPAPKNVKIRLDSNGFRLTWDRDTCRLAFGYNIYRRIDSSFWKHGTCETGVPASTGYVLYDTTRGVNNTQFFDNNNGKGISPFIRYCYIITSSYYPRNENGTVILVGERTESYASDEVCDMVLRTKPIITKVSVRNTGTLDGSMQIDWIKPTSLDTTQFPPPYSMQLQRGTSLRGPFTNIGSAYNFATFSSLSDLSYIDSFLNTTNTSYYYKVQFSASRDAVLKVIEESSLAGSVYLNANPTNRSILLKWNPETPWINKEAKIFRQIGLNTFNLVGLTQTQSFLDTGLVNGQSYCYQIETKGNYDTNYYPAPIYNFSQLVCAIPIDTIRPCAPILSIDTPCQNFTILEIKLHWKYPASCDQDVVKYRIYWKKNLKEKWELIDSVPLGTNEYIDSREKLKFSIAGCYAVSAVDSFENESFLDNEKCVDNCPYYSIPNVFSPGLDGLNDVLKPFPYRFIDDIHLQIYNRWGQLVFETRNLDFTWDGTDQKNGKALSEGVYYYLLDINESYLAGSKKRSNRGTLTIIR